MRGGGEVQKQELWKKMKLRKLKGRDVVANYDAVNKVEIFNFAEIISN